MSTPFYSAIHTVGVLRQAGYSLMAAVREAARIWGVDQNKLYREMTEA